MECNVSTVRRLGLRIAPADSCAIVRTDARELRSGRLHLVPGEPAIVEARLQNRRGASIAHTIKMHLVTVHLYENTRWRMCPQIIRAFYRLIDGSNDSKQDNEACHSSKKISDPPQDAFSRWRSTAKPGGLNRHGFLSIDKGEKDTLGRHC